MAKAARRRVAATGRGQARGSQRAAGQPARGASAQPAAPRGTTQRLSPPARRRNPFAFLRRLEPRFVADIIGELRKVTWPSFAETRYLTLVVAIVSLAVGMLLGGLDIVFGWVIERLFF